MGIDGHKVEWDEIRKALRSPETVGLPRLLVIQACKGVAQGSQFVLLELNCLSKVDNFAVAI